MKCPRSTPLNVYRFIFPTASRAIAQLLPCRRCLKSLVSIHRVPHLRRSRAFEVPEYVCLPGASHLRHPANACISMLLERLAPSPTQGLKFQPQFADISTVGPEHPTSYTPGKALLTEGLVKVYDKPSITPRNRFSNSTR